MILTQRDVVEQRLHRDAVSFGGWAIDLHPAEGVYSNRPGCAQWHAKGVYQIPYRCFYSRNIENLFLAGRIVSVSHVAFGSTRVMATCGHNAQAVGMAAALCHETGNVPRGLLEDSQMEELQRRLMKAGQYIPGLILNDPADLARHARISASSEYVLDELAPDGENVPLTASRAMLLPVTAGPLPAVTFFCETSEPAHLEVEVRASSKQGNFTPDTVLYRQRFRASARTRSGDPCSAHWRRRERLLPQLLPAAQSVRASGDKRFASDWCVGVVAFPECCRCKGGNPGGAA